IEIPVEPLRYDSDIKVIKEIFHEQTENDKDRLISHERSNDEAIIDSNLKNYEIIEGSGESSNIYDINKQEASNHVEIIDYPYTESSKSKVEQSSKTLSFNRNNTLNNENYNQNLPIILINNNDDNNIYNRRIIH